MTRISYFFLFCFLMITISYSQTYNRANIFYDNFDDISKYLEHDEIDIVHHYERFTKYVDVYLSSTYYNTLESEGLNIILTATTVDESHKSYILGPRWDDKYGYYPKYGQFDSLLEYYEKTYPKIAKRGVLPIKTIYGRDIFYLKISNSPNSDNKKPEVCVQGVIHGDEPIGAGIVRDGIEYLCENYDKDPEIKWLIDNRQIYFLPVKNVDRYVWNENQKTSKARRRKTMDYKNGNANNSETDGGVDPNRNFPYKWGLNDQGSSPNPTAMNYRGSSPADQKCVQSLIQFFKEHKFRFWNVYHSSGEKVIIPFAYAQNLTLPEYDSTVFHSVYHEWQKFYPAFDGCGPAWEFYFPLNGSTEDWGYATDDTTYRVYSYITELGPGTSGAYWFSDAKSKEMCEQMLQCDIFMAKAAGFYPVLNDIKITDNDSGNGDGKLNPGETVKLYVKIENKSAVDTTNVEAFLNSSDKNIKIVDSVGNYGDVMHVQTVENSTDPFEFKCKSSVTSGTPIQFNVRLEWTMNSAKFEKVFPCTLLVGPLVSVKNNQSINKKGGLKVFTGTDNQFVKFQIVIPSGYLNSGNKEIKFGVYNASGRLVRKLDFSSNTQSNLISWDKTNDSGAKITSGIYFLKMNIADFNTFQKFIIRK